MRLISVKKFKQPLCVLRRMYWIIYIRTSIYLDNETSFFFQKYNFICYGKIITRKLYSLRSEIKWTIELTHRKKIYRWNSKVHWNVFQGNWFRSYGRKPDLRWYLYQSIDLFTQSQKTCLRKNSSLRFLCKIFLHCFIYVTESRYWNIETNTFKDSVT